MLSTVETRNALASIVDRMGAGLWTIAVADTYPQSLLGVTVSRMVGGEWRSTFAPLPDGTALDAVHVIVWLGAVLKQLAVADVLEQFTYEGRNAAATLLDWQQSVVRELRQEATNAVTKAEDDIRCIGESVVEKIVRDRAEEMWANGVDKNKAGA